MTRNVLWGRATWQSEGKKVAGEFLLRKATRGFEEIERGTNNLKQEGKNNEEFLTNESTRTLKTQIEKKSIHIRVLGRIQVGLLVGMGSRAWYRMADALTCIP